MDSTVFKYNHHQHQQQHQQHYTNNTSSSNNIQNNNNQNSIFILNTASSSILANNPKLHYNDFNDNNNVEPTLSSNNAASSSTSSSVWSSASSTMCSPAAHAIQKLFNCSSNSLKLNQGNCNGIETKSFKSNAELLKKKTKIWKYLEGETNENNNYNSDHPKYSGNNVKRTKDQGKSCKTKSKYWSKSYDSDNQNSQDLSELLEYSCSLCDNCRCIDCQIAYFDCDNSDDSNSEYSFHMNAYEEDDEEAGEDISDAVQQQMELKTTKDNQNTKQTLIGSNNMDNKHAIHKLDSKQITSYDKNPERDVSYEYDRCCQQCLDKQMMVLTTNRDH